MKLWLLKPRKDISEEINPWEPWYDSAMGFVIRAEDETTARRIAEQNAGDERQRANERLGIWKVWHDPDLTTCVELPIDGQEELILRDFAAA